MKPPKGNTMPAIQQMLPPAIVIAEEQGEGDARNSHPPHLPPLIVNMESRT